MQRVTEASASVIAGFEYGFGVALAGKPGRTASAGSEAGPFLVGPGDDFEGPLVLHALLLKRTQYRKSSHHPQGTVIASSLRLAIQMTADKRSEERRVGK